MTMDDFKYILNTVFHLKGLVILFSLFKSCTLPRGRDHSCRLMELPTLLNCKTYMSCANSER